MADLPASVAWTRRLESASVLDPVVTAVRPLVGALVSDPRRRDALRGTWLGHALHPVLTDVPIGMWTSALTLDLIGGPASRPAATRLIAIGILAAGPTFVTGWADWSTLEPRDQRVGVVHAVTNAVAVGLFAASWRARRRNDHARGKVLGLAASSVLGVGGYLGGHLAAIPHVTSRS